VYCSVGVAKSGTQVAFGQGNSSYARYFPMPKKDSSAGISETYLSSLLMTRTIPYRLLFLDLNTLVSIAYLGEASMLPKEYAEPWVCKYQITNVDCFLFRIIH